MKFYAFERELTDRNIHFNDRIEMIELIREFKEQIFNDRIDKSDSVDQEA